MTGPAPTITGWFAKLSSSARLTPSLKAMTGSAALALLFSTAPAYAEDYVKQYHTYTANGPTDILGGWTCWFSDCKYAPCHMVPEQKPRLGALRAVVKDEPLTNSGHCDGKVLPKLHLIYTPRPGAHGGDDIVLRSRSENGGRHLIIIHVDVP